MEGDALGQLIATLGSVDNDEIDWQNVRQATVLIHQTFRYDYPSPITELRQRLMVVPPDYHGRQRLVAHKLRVTGCDLDSERSYDSFGNVVLDLSLDDVDDHVEFSTWAVVECDAPIDGWENPDDVGFDRRFAEASRLTRPDDALRAVAETARATGLQELELAARLCALIHEHFAYAWGITTVETTAAEAWAGAEGVCQDYAHCMLALARLCGLPARYVSGHLLGDGGTHAWVEVLVQEDGGSVRAVPFDPTHNRRAGTRYVTVAVGRDYIDVAPTSGTFVGLHSGELTTHKRAAVTRVEYLQPPRRRRITRL
ncbi:MAG: transglutaminase family protein [Actinobacteria bacterium]|nr:transglutaminase family protein [Actinomycetota bacterium]